MSVVDNKQADKIEFHVSSEGPSSGINFTLVLLYHQDIVSRSIDTFNVSI